MVDQISVAQGELVLIDPVGQPGASNSPDEAAPTTCHTVTPVTANRAATATAAARIAATASAHTDPTGCGGTGSGATAHNSVVNQPRTASTRPPKRRSHSRTVPSGRASNPAIGRAPTPAAFAAIAAPTTPAASARRSNTPNGSSTCVDPHPPHLARRGRTRNRPASPRITRARAYPHPASTPAHPGHANSPANSRRSTTATSTPTVNTGASVHHRAALPNLAKGTREGRCPSKPPHSDDEQQEGQPIGAALEHILTINDASRPLRPHPECAGTTDPTPAVTVNGAALTQPAAPLR